jgi:hypothetical protein
MKHIIHDWDNEQAIAILKNCHQAMVENGKLLLVEAVIQPGNQMPLPKGRNPSYFFLSPPWEGGLGGSIL